jgi:hypothetical protein
MYFWRNISQYSASNCLFTDYFRLPLLPEAPEALFLFQQQQEWAR